MAGCPSASDSTRPRRASSASARRSRRRGRNPDSLGVRIGVAVKADDDGRVDLDGTLAPVADLAALARPPCPSRRALPQDPGRHRAVPPRGRRRVQGVRMSVVAVNGSPSTSSKTHAVAAAAVEIAGEGTVIDVGTLDAEALLIQRGAPRRHQRARRDRGRVDARPRHARLPRRRTAGSSSSCSTSSRPMRPRTPQSCLPRRVRRRHTSSRSTPACARPSRASVAGRCPPSSTRRARISRTRNAPLPSILETLARALGEAARIFPDSSKESA